ncbi:hypothetical protein BKA66DRAFT_467783 [Pyrenochaeta sp. MPI-SDFR-AT-0127]|nr:hypothetical protein BKA66DRAFT_467783 [Pyrenochaeta sp. MPI-SDFR-AT-0127]
MQFFNLLLLAPVLVGAMPQISTRQADVTEYTYTFPSAYIAAHPEVPATAVFNQAQLDKLSAYVPVEVTSNKEIKVTGEVDVQKISDDAQDEVSIQAPNPRCLTCLAACAILGPLGPEAVAPCIAFCLVKSFCRG